MEEMGKQQREKMLLQAAFEKSLLKKRRDNLPPSVDTAVAPQMAHSSALQQKVCSPLARSPKSSSSPAPLHPTSSVSIAREPESNPKPKSWFILAIGPGFGSSFHSGWRIRRSAMNEKASVSKELNTKHKKVRFLHGRIFVLCPLAMEEMGKQQREKMLLQAAFEKSLLKKRRDDLPPSVDAAVVPQMAHSSALQQKVCSPLARSPKSSSSPAPLHPTSSVSIAREPESNPKPKSWFILAINPGFGSNFRSGWRIRRSAMNKKASVSKELNAKHKKVITSMALMQLMRPSLWMQQLL